MIVIDIKGRVNILTTDVPESFAFVPKAMVAVLQMAMEADSVDKSAKDYIITYLGHLQDILPENYELEYLRNELEAKSNIVSSSNITQEAKAKV